MYAVLFIPDFALQSLRRERPDLEGQPLALLADESRKAPVLQVSAEARASRVDPGLTATQALARCPGLVLRYRSPKAEAASARVLLDAAFTLAPRVEATADGLCTVDLQGVADRAMEPGALQVVHRLKALGLSLCIGLSDTPDRAIFAARCARPVLRVDSGDASLGRLPLEMIHPPPGLGQVLDQWGIHTLGALTALPRPEVGRRLGEAGLDLWDRASGRRERVLRLVTRPDVFEETLELEHEMETLEPLLFLLRRFVDTLVLRLEASWVVAESLGLYLKLANDTVYKKWFRLPEPTRKVELIFRMLHSHLEQVRTEHAITAVHLRIKPGRVQARQQGLFEADLRDSHQFAETLARVVAVVGSGRVGTPRVEETHKPDTFHLESLETAVGEIAEEDSPLPPLGLPLRRYRPPRPAQVDLRHDVPDAVFSPEIHGQVRAWRGPWRLSGDWWENSRRWAREEWDVELVPGGVYRLVRDEDKRGFLEGVYG
jgi:protein ImuB